MRLWHEIIKLNHSYVTFGLWRGGRGLVDICQGCCMPCLHRSWYPPLFKMIPPFKFNTFSSTLVLKNLHHRGQADNTPSDGFSLSLKRYHTKYSASAVSRRREKKKVLLCAQDDGSHMYTSYLANSSMYCAYYLPMTANWSQTAISLWSNSITIWITLCMHQMKFWRKKKKHKAKQGQNTFQLNLKVALLLACHALHLSRLIIQSENENWSPKHLYLNKDRAADYECSKCNFYYTSIILLLITDSFSLSLSLCALRPIAHPVFMCM